MQIANFILKAKQNLTILTEAIIGYGEIQ